MRYDDISPLFEILNQNQIDVLKNGYDALLENIGLDYQSDISVDNTILVVGTNDLSSEFIKKAGDRFHITQKPHIHRYDGNLGDFVSIYDGEELHSSQIVFFVKPDSNAQDSDTMGKTRLGIHFASEYKDEDSMIKAVENLIGDFVYENTILFRANKCQYHHRNKTANEYCSECESACPTFAITKDEVAKELRFSDIDCIFCGKCVGVCPSGAMQKANATLDSITKAARVYRGEIPLIVGKNDVESVLDLGDMSEVIPFVIPNINMLNEVYLISILQEVGRGIVIFGEIAPNLADAIAFIDELYMRVCDKRAIYLAHEMPSKIENLPIYRYNAESSEFNREIFKERVKFLIRDGDYGTLRNKPSIKYTDLTIDGDSCTLCMSCVESCNTKALISSKDCFALLFNPSICTACNLCVDICPESIIKMPLLGMRLHHSFFVYGQKAHDEPFKCIECGKVFASAKSIKKVQGLISPFFGDDDIKKKSILCCSDCKVRLIFRADMGA